MQPTVVEQLPHPVMFAQDRGVDMPGWYFASTDAATLERLARDVGFTYRASPKGFDHITQTTVIDRAGRVVGRVSAAP